EPEPKTRREQARSKQSPKGAWTISSFIRSSARRRRRESPPVRGSDALPLSRCRSVKVWRAGSAKIAVKNARNGHSLRIAVLGRCVHLRWVAAGGGDVGAPVSDEGRAVPRHERHRDRAAPGDAREADERLSRAIQRRVAVRAGAERKREEAFATCARYELEHD